MRKEKSVRVNQVSKYAIYHYLSSKDPSISALQWLKDIIKNASLFPINSRSFAETFANALETSGLSREEVVANDELLFYATHLDRVDLINTLLNIPGWSFKPQEGVTVCHIATRFKSSALYYLLLAAPHPSQMLDYTFDSDGKSVRELALQNRHPLSSFLDYLVKAEYPKTFLVYHSSGEKNYLSSGQLAERHPLISSYFPKSSLIYEDHHLLSTLTEAVRYLPHGTNPFRHVVGTKNYNNGGPFYFGNFFLNLAGIGNCNNNRLCYLDNFFRNAIKENVRIIYIPESLRLLYPGKFNESDNSENSLASYQKWNRERFSKSLSQMTSTMRKYYHRCLKKNDRLACYYLAHQENEEQYKSLWESLCQYLEKNILIVPAGNEGRDVQEELNFYTINLPCPDNHRIVATRAELNNNLKVFEQILQETNYGSSCLLFPTTALQTEDCIDSRLCVGFRLGTSYAVPQALGVVMQIASVLKQKGIDWDADLIIKILNQGCIEINDSKAAKCVVDPQAVFLAAANFDKNTNQICYDNICYSEISHMPRDSRINIEADSDSALITIEPNLTTLIIVPTAQEILSSIGCGVVQGVVSGVIGHAVNQQAEKMLHKIIVFNLLYFPWILFCQYCYLVYDPAYESPHLESLYLKAIIEAFSIFIFQVLLMLFNMSIDWSAEKARSYKYTGLSKTLGIFGMATQAVQYALPVFKDPISTVSSVAAGTLTRRTLKKWVP